MTCLETMWHLLVVYYCSHECVTRRRFVQYKLRLFIEKIQQIACMSCIVRFTVKQSDVKPVKRTVGPGLRWPGDAAQLTS